MQISVTAKAQQSSPSATVAKHQEQVVVTGTYAPIPLDEADRTVDSIPIGQSPTVFRNAMDALQSNPSVDVQQRAPGVQGDLSIRGSSFGQTLVLVNGLRLNDAQTAHNNLDLPFPFEAVQRIEVLEGSGSTLYGSDALGGVVNFITAAPSVSEGRFGAAGGSFGTNEQNGSLAYIAKKISEQATFTRELSTGFMPDRDYRSLAFGSQTGFQSGLGHSDVLLGWSDRPFGAAQFYGNYPSWERTRGWFAGARQELGEKTEVDFGFRRHTDLFDLFRYQPWIYENRHATESYQIGLRRHQEINNTMRLYYGAEGYRDVIDSNNLGHHQRNRGAVYGGFDARALRRFSLSIGAREEVFSGGNKRFSPSISGGYWVNSHLKLHGAASSAFRLPTFTDLYYSDPANLGNPNLKPESAWSYEGGAQVNSGRHSGDFVVFHRRERNDIDYVRSGPNEIWRAQNIQRLQFTGFEAVFRLQIASSQRVDIAYTGLHGAQAAMNGEQSKYVFQYPVHSGTLTWWGHGPQHIDTHLRMGVLQRYRRDPYPLIELSAERAFAYVKPFVQLTNATNTCYEEIPGVRMPGRAAIAGMEFYWRQR
ncbi:MAG: TonB-dependent receptor [Acidobacteriaceae bacterium]|nr:TonB-dependent receptor [Acidobacteriaceae bacterium]